jgi:hypothetical protein
VRALVKRDHANGVPQLSLASRLAAQPGQQQAGSQNNQDHDAVNQTALPQAVLNSNGSPFLLNGIALHACSCMWRIQPHTCCQLSEQYNAASAMEDALSACISSALL